MSTIDPVREDTLPLFMRGLRGLSEDLGDPFTVSRETLAQALFSTPAACHGLLAQDAGQPQGVALFSPVMSTLKGTAGIYVSDLWVAEEARGGGLGRRLLSAVAQQGQTLWSAGYMGLASYVDNPRAEAFYRRAGFLPVERETMLRLSGAAFDKFARDG